MAALNMSAPELMARAVTKSVSISATNADYEIAPAATGLIPVIVSGKLTFSGAYTLAFEDSGDTALTGAMAFSADGVLEIEIGKDFIKGTESLALDLNATKTAGNVTGWLNYVYIPGTSV